MPRLPPSEPPAHAPTRVPPRPTPPSLASTVPRFSVPSLLQTSDFQFLSQCNVDQFQALQRVLQAQDYCCILGMPGTVCLGGGGGGLGSALRWGEGRGAFEGKGPPRRPQQRLGRRLEEVVKAVGGGYYRLQMLLRRALAGRAPWQGGGVPPPLAMPPCGGRGSVCVCVCV